MISTNGNRGLISKIVDDGRTVIIDLPKGGSIRAPNMGAFEVGDEVAFTLDATERRVVVVMPIEMANWYKAMGENELIQLSLKEDQRGTILYIDNDPDNGHAIEIPADCSGRESGEVDSGGGDYPIDEHLYADSDGLEGEGGVLSEGSGEADNLLIPLLHGHDDFEEMGNGEYVDAGRPFVDYSERD